MIEQDKPTVTTSCPLAEIVIKQWDADYMVRLGRPKVLEPCFKRLDVKLMEARQNNSCLKDQLVIAVAYGILKSASYYVNEKADLFDEVVKASESIVEEMLIKQLKQPAAET